MKWANTGGIMNSHLSVWGRNSCLANSPSVLFHNLAWKFNYSDLPFQKQSLNDVTHLSVIRECKLEMYVFGNICMYTQVVNRWGC